MKVSLVFVLALFVGFAVSIGTAQEAPRTLEQCEVESLDLRDALVNAQEAAALWQARAIAAESKLARQALAQKRAGLPKTDGTGPR